MKIELDPFAYRRRQTRVVRVGDVRVGGGEPIRIQSMTTPATTDTPATVKQIVRLVEAGCEIVRLTVPSSADADNLPVIRKELESRGLYLPTRGRLKGIGRGQTHKAQIVGRWLRGETYDQIRLHTRHSLSSIKRYVQSFVRVADLHRQRFSESEIALVLEFSAYLVGEYLAVYHQHRSIEYQERLTDQIERLRKAPQAKKGAL